MEMIFFRSIVTDDEIRMNLGGKRFSTEEEVEGDVERWTKMLAGNCFEEDIKKLIKNQITDEGK